MMPVYVAEYVDVKGEKKVKPVDARTDWEAIQAVNQLVSRKLATKMVLKKFGKEIFTAQV